jgi:hypothetical protein
MFIVHITYEVPLYFVYQGRRYPPNSIAILINFTACSRSESLIIRPRVPPRSRRLFFLALQMLQLLPIPSHFCLILVLIFLSFSDFFSSIFSLKVSSPTPPFAYRQAFIHFFTCCEYKSFFLQYSAYPISLGMQFLVQSGTYPVNSTYLLI